MNKRHRKKQRTRWRQREAECLAAHFCLRPDTTSLLGREKWLAHPRRRWLPAAVCYQHKAQLERDIAAERAAVRELQETHIFTLGGWIPKRTERGER